MTVIELDRFRAIPTAKVTELPYFTGQIAVERSAAHFTQLQNARAAFRRIQDSSFGMRDYRDQDIHPKRLAAVRWAGFSVRSHGAADHNSGYEQNQAAGNNLLGRAA